MTKKVIAIVQARLGSKRFPGKSLASFHGSPMIYSVLDRACSTKGIAHVVAAVPTRDTALIDSIERYGRVSGNSVSIVYGPERNVLLRFFLAATTYKADVIMRITGDCPLWVPRAGEEVLAAYLSDPDKREFWSNDTRNSGWPDGTDVEVFSMSLLRRACRARKLTDADLEHVTTWMRRTLDRKVGVVHRSKDLLSHLKFSVDTRKDLLDISTSEAKRLIQIIEDGGTARAKGKKEDLQELTERS